MDFRSKLMTHFHLSEADYAHWTRPLALDDLPSPTIFKDLMRAVTRIRQAMAKQEKIVIYGDYDCDGVMATSILVKTFNDLAYPVGYYVPSRYLDGYGLNVKKVDEFAQKGYTLILTVDNGIAANEAIDAARAQGIDVIVTDHHEASGPWPQAYAILHPVLTSTSPSYSCGSYVAFMLSYALSEHLDPYLLSLAGIATISDMMPLSGVNRDLVRLALETLNQHQYPQIRALIDHDDIDEKTIGMEIAPKINAVGRMIENTTINRLIRYFTSHDAAEINELAAWLTAINLERRSLMKEAGERHGEQNAEDPAIVIVTHQKEGLIGLVANHLLNRYHRPVVVFTDEGGDPDILKGSARSETGFNVSKAFQSLEALLVTGGGHGLAGGLSIRKADFAAFKDAFFALASEHPITKEIPDAIPLELAELTWDHYALLRTFAPFGQDFPAPHFLMRGLKTSQFAYMSMDRHLSTMVGMDVRLLGFNMGKLQLSPLKYVDLIGEWEVNVYKGRRYLTFRATDFSRAEV